jgi:type VI secretion system secreted protein Hcp
VKKNAIIIIFACFCFFSISGSAFCDFAVFMNIPGTPGESTDADHQDWIDITAFSWRLGGQSGAFDHLVRGASVRRSDVGPLTITKALDKASPKIIFYALKGEHIDEVIIELCRTEGDKAKFYEIKMENVFISHVFPHAERNSSSALPTESVDFEFGKVTVTYTEYSHSTGEPMGDVYCTYDRLSNTFE